MLTINPTRNLFVLSAALLALAAPIGYAQTPASPSAAPAPPIKFDIVSYKPCEHNMLGSKDAYIPLTGDTYAMHCQTVHHLMEFAFDGGAPYLIKGEPDWVDTDTYEFLAKVAPEDVPVWQKLDSQTRRLVALAALEDTLNLKLRRETQPRPVYNLVVAKDGPKFPEHKPGPDDPPDDVKITKGAVHWIAMDTAQYTNVPMNQVADGIAARLDRGVVDKTGLTGRYDLIVHPLPYPHYDPKSSNVEDTDFSGIINGVKDLGLRLEPAKADTLVLFVDHIDRPPTD